ncbi:MAG: aldo/keto reductase, partial [Limnohabitans sp.]
AWLLHQGPDILPIPGTTSVAHLHDNLGAPEVRLRPELIARLDDLIHTRTVSGNRYSEQANREVDTEVF